MISFIIITYNNDSFVLETIESCLSQKTTIPLEIVVINDGSTDKTKQILKYYKNKIRIFNRKNYGIEKSFNFALKKISGNFFVRLDSDDYINNNFVKSFEKDLKKNYDFFYSNYNVVNDNGEIIYKSKLPKFNKEEIFCRGDFLASGTVFKKKVLNLCSGYNYKKTNNGLENYEFILDLMSKNCKGFLIKDILWNYRVHNNNLSKIKKKEIVDYGKKLFIKKKYGIFQTNRYHPLFINRES